MRRFILWACLMLIGIGAWAQERQVTGVVYNREDGQPMVGAEVSVEGTSMVTVTDLDGRFRFDAVPADARYVKLSSIGMVPMTARIPREEGQEMSVRMERVERKITPFVQAGVLLTGHVGSSELSASAKVGYQVGVGASFYLTRYFSFTPSINFVQKSISYDGIGDFNPVYLQIPLLVESKLWLRRKASGTRLIFSYGPYVACGIAGKAKAAEGGEKVKIFSGEDGMEALFNRFDLGLHLGFGAQLKHLYLGLNVKGGFLNQLKDSDYTINLFTADLTVGYRF